MTTAQSKVGVREGQLLSRGFVEADLGARTSGGQGVEPGPDVSGHEGVGLGHVERLDLRPVVEVEVGAGAGADLEDAAAGAAGGELGATAPSSCGLRAR